MAKIMGFQFPDHTILYKTPSLQTELEFLLAGLIYSETMLRNPQGKKLWVASRRRMWPPATESIMKDKRAASS